MENWTNEIWVAIGIAFIVGLFIGYIIVRLTKGSVKHQAKTEAEGAKTTAEAADRKAGEAKTTADTAQTTAQDADAKAEANKLKIAEIEAKLPTELTDSEIEGAFNSVFGS